MVAMSPPCLSGETPNGKTAPPGKTLSTVFAKWKMFAERMTLTVSEHYGSEGWERM